MNKTQLIEHIAQSADVSKAVSEKVLNTVLDSVKVELKKGGSVQLIGFGTFTVAKRAARAGRNPSTGEALQIKASNAPKFTPGKALKDALN